MDKSCYLVLENGERYKGKSFGAEGEVIAEIVFATGMTGYLETLTDKSYGGQAVIQTFPLIGNYGIIPSDFESDCVGPVAYIVKEWCRHPSNFRNEGDIDTFLKDNGITGIYGIDTRSLTKTIREYGVMNGIITTDPDNVDLNKVKAYKVENAVSQVSVKNSFTEKAEDGKRNVVLMDYGYKENIKRELIKRGCNVTVMPYNATPEEILGYKPDGIMLSNGPGDPAENTEVIANLKELIKSDTPIFGICLGHQLLALANGFSTKKLHYGHRGANQPAREVETGRVYITSQNHGYAVVSESIKGSAKESFVNANDSSCEGIEYTDFPGFSVQFHPEACGGPRDTAFLFDKFISMMEVR